MKPCSRCGLRFRAYHGNQRYCGSCRQKRSFGPRSSSTRALGVRICAVLPDALPGAGREPALLLEALQGSSEAGSHEREVRSPVAPPRP